MRLHRLELQAFGPFATLQVIDFERLTSSGIFMLEGPTGAGKSTILDAITFAFYGGLASDASRDRLHSDFAAPGVEPKVTLEFSVAGKRRRVTRVPEHERRKKRGEGFTTQPSQVHLEALEGETWKSVSDNNREVGDIVLAVLGLSREQFTQVVLLPQNEFAKFLESNDDERRDLLTKLFGTRLYDLITAELERGRGGANKEREAAKLEVQHALAAAAEAAALEGEAQATLLSLAGEDRAVALMEISSTLASAQAASARGLDEATRTLASCKARHDVATKRSELMSRRVETLRKVEAHVATRAEHDDQVAVLAAARNAAPVRPLLEALDRANETVTANQVELQRVAPDATADMLAGRGAEGLSRGGAAAERTATELQHLVEALGQGHTFERLKRLGHGDLLGEVEMHCITLVQALQRSRVCG